MPLSPEQDKAVDAFLKRQGQTPGEPPKEEEAGSTSGDFARGVGQGLLGYAEAPAQWVEHGIRNIPGMSEFKMPLHDWAADYRRRAESSPAGIAGEVAGSIAPMFIPVGGWLGGLARAAGGAEDAARLAQAARAAGAVRQAGPLGLAPAEAANPAAAAVRGAGTAARSVPGIRTASQVGPQPTIAGQAGRFLAEHPKTAFALKSGAVADLAQPASDKDFGREMASRFALGAGLGGLTSQYMRLLNQPERLPFMRRVAGVERRPMPEAAGEQVVGERGAEYYRPRPQSEPVTLRRRKDTGPQSYFAPTSKTEIKNRLTERGWRAERERKLEEMGYRDARHAYWMSRLASIPGFVLGHGLGQALGFPFYVRHGLAHLLGLAGRRAGYAAAGRASPYIEQAVQGATPGIPGAAASQVPNVPYYGWEALTGGPDEDPGD